MVFIRTATKDDNQNLLDLEAKCPQGTNLVLGFERSPDFFLRSRSYPDYRIYVAEDEGEIAGTVACTIKQFCIGEEKVHGVYLYDLRVHPDHRGKGVGSKLVSHVLEEVDGETRFAYAVIMDENQPSKALFQKAGFRRIHDVALLNVPLFKRRESASGKVRRMTEEDVGDVVTLLDGEYRNRGLPTFGVADFLERTRRLQGYGLNRIQVVEDGNRIVACAGLWDYSAIFRVSALRVSAKLWILAHAIRFVGMFRDTMKLPLVGEPFRVMYVMDFAYLRDDFAGDLIKYCLDLANQEGCNFLSFTINPNDSTDALLAKYNPIRIKYNVYAKGLANNAQLPESVFIDPVDL